MKWAESTQLFVFSRLFQTYRQGATACVSGLPIILEPEISRLKLIVYYRTKLKEHLFYRCEKSLKSSLQIRRKHVYTTFLIEATIWYATMNVTVCFEHDILKTIGTTKRRVW